MAISDNWTPLNIAWAAGLFEGEGSISIKKQTAQLALGMTDEDIVRRFSHIIGLGKIYGPYQEKRSNTYKPMWIWSVGGARQCQAVLAALWSHLGERRKAKAEQAIIVCSKWSHPRDRIKCSHGHVYGEETTYVWNGHRICRICSSVRAATVAAKRRLARTGRVDFNL